MLFTFRLLLKRKILRACTSQPAGGFPVQGHIRGVYDHAVDFARGPYRHVTLDHVFQDILGVTVRGREVTAAAWLAESYNVARAERVALLGVRRYILIYDHAAR